RLVAAEQAKGNTGNMRRLLYMSLSIVLALSLLLTGVLYFGAGFIGANILNEPRVILSLRILSFSFVFMALGSCLRGYFLGLQKTAVPATSQIIEQMARIGVIVLLAGFFIPWGLEYAIAMAALGIVVGEALSFGYVFFSYRFGKKSPSKLPKKPPTVGRRATLLAIAAMATPLTLNRVASSFLSSVENIMIPSRLQVYGMAAEEAMATFGRITGMAMPLIFFPSAVLVALSVSLVPSISEGIALGHTKRINSTICKSIVFTSIIAFGAGLIFVVLPDEIGQLVYRENLGQILLLLGFMCPFWYLNITLNGLLSGLGEQLFIFRTGLLSSGINIAFVFFFVPIYGIHAFLMGWLISLLIVTILDIRRLKKVVDIKIDISRWFIKPAIAALFSGLIVNLIHNRVISATLPPLPAAILSLIFLMTLYAIAIIGLKIISLKEVKGMINFKK
ncbi:MAG: polysaccharide biosynthesis C-terminal domain-containing protein, partial [Defluviitaleaceae bacterium]|nr:polysaccharide biosynthesis C-terminal domain-containing protein [Defluviitaleaceae bacterium]